jgi:hypothetical protein
MSRLEFPLTTRCRRGPLMTQGCYQLLKAIAPATTDVDLVTTITTVILQVAMTSLSKWRV